MLSLNLYRQRWHYTSDLLPSTSKYWIIGVHHHTWLTRTCINFTCRHICAPHVCSAQRGQKRAPEIQELELQKVAIWFFYKTRKCSYLLSHPSNPITFSSPSFLPFLWNSFLFFGFVLLLLVFLFWVFFLLFLFSELTFTDLLGVTSGCEKVTFPYAT